jgi:uncharacterized protein YecE (DUF72 family)
MAGVIRIGVGGWTFAPWRGTFYPEGLVHKKELSFASRQLTSIEINGTYYSRFKPDSWRKWRDETPDDFVFAVKGSRFCTNRKDLRTAGEAIENFLSQGLVELGAKLGPINWQLAKTKKFDADEMAGFLDLLKSEQDGLPLRHAVEVRHPSFVNDTFFAMVRKRSVAIVVAMDEEFPEIEVETAGFTYARLMESREDEQDGLSRKELAALARRIRSWARRGDVFAYFISGAKVRNPAAAHALLGAIGDRRSNR